MLMSLILMLNSCFVIYDREHYIINNKFEEFIDAIKNEDKDALVSLFSVYAQNESDNIEKDAEKLFEYIEGSIESYDGGFDGSASGREDGKRNEYMSGSYDLITSVAEYHIDLNYVNVDEAMPNKEGVSSINVIKKEDGIYVYGPDYWTSPGINIDTKKSTDNANLSVGGRTGYDGSVVVFCVGQTLMNVEISDNTSTVSTVREFKAKTPMEITYDGQTIYFKLITNDSQDSPLYAFSTDRNVRNTKIRENVGFYKIHDYYFYYTLTDENLNKGIYRHSTSSKETTRELVVEGDISEFVFRHGKMYYVEDNKLMFYNISDTKNDIVIDTGDMEIYDIDYADNKVYYCTALADGTESYINRVDLTTGETKVLYTGVYCRYLHTVRDNRLIFKTEDGYVIMDLGDGSIKSILDDYDLSELYVYEDALFFNVIDEASEHWYKVDIDSFEVIKIV